MNIHFQQDMSILAKLQSPPVSTNHSKKSVSKLRLINTTQHQKPDASEPNYINLYFECLDYEGSPRIGEPEKCDDLIWVSINEFHTIPIIDSVLSSLKAALNNIPYSSIGFKE